MWYAAAYLRCSWQQSPTVPMVGTPVLDSFVYSACHLSRFFCERLQFLMRRGPNEASTILTSKNHTFVPAPGVRRLADGGKGMTRFVRMTVGPRVWMHL